MLKTFKKSLQGGTRLHRTPQNRRLRRKEYCKNLIEACHVTYSCEV